MTKKAFVELIARPDRGAAHCIFERSYAEELGLDVESGRLQRFRTMAGSTAFVSESSTTMACCV